MTGRIPARAAFAGAPLLVPVAHGSRNGEHTAVVRAVAARMRAASGAAVPGRAGAPGGAGVAEAFLDHAEPRLPALLDTLAARGHRTVTVVPLLLGNAYHAKTDIPAVLAEAARRHPGLTAAQAPVLGPSRLLAAALRRRVDEAGGAGPADGLLVGWAGSSDPEAAAAVRATAARTAPAAHAVDTAAANAAPASVAAAVDRLAAAGARRIVLARYMLAPGLLPDRLASAARAAAADRGLPVAVAEVLGAAPEIAELALRRAAEAARPLGQAAA